MKKLFLFVLLASSVLAKAQITLLHTFEDDGDPMVYSQSIIEDAGYYCFFSDSTDEINIYHFPTFYFYDSDFNFYKSFQFELGRYSSVSVFPTRHLINNDDAMELIVDEYTTTSNGSTSHSYIMKEDGAVIYDFGDCCSNRFNFFLVNGEIRLLRDVYYYDGVSNAYKLEVYGTGGDYSTGEFHLVNVVPAYPNPARSSIILPYELENGESTTMSIYDLNGRLIEKFDIGSHFNQVQLNVNSYAPGIYIYEYKGRSNKFVVQ